MPPPDLPAKENCTYYLGTHFAFTLGIGAELLNLWPNF